jgi:uncharacterized protein YndB with AHSA1/START domain
MNTPRRQDLSTPKTYELKLEKTLNAPVAKVWKALTEGVQIPAWYGPMDEFRVEVHQWDCKPGGKYRVAMHAPDGNVYTCIGEFKEIKPTQRLSYTWSWEGQDPMDSLVVFTIAPKGGETVLRLSHTGLPSAESKEQHDQGWVGCLAQLEARVAT